jgi:hypothetical protein
MVGSFGLSGAIFTADIGSQGPRVAAPDGAIPLRRFSN